MTTKELLERIERLEQQVARLSRHTHNTSPGGYTGGPVYPRSNG
jgi:hypothetical protein